MEFHYRETSGISSSAVDAAKPLLGPYIDSLRTVRGKGGYEAPESSINLPYDEALLDTCVSIVEEKKIHSVKYIFLIGIGGSNLGVRALYDALYGGVDQLDPHRFPKMFFLDTVSGVDVSAYETLLKEIKHRDEVLIIVVSKSGTTVETIAHTEHLLDQLSSHGEDIFSRVVMITDEGSPLWKDATEKSIITLPIPAPVGGRYSVFSSVGIFPLLCAGVDVDEFRAGAQRAVENGLYDGESNHALITALALFENTKKGKTIHNSFFFTPRLESLGKWYRQLLGESIGKTHNEAGEVVHAGITPIISIGSVDLHSVGQLYVGGPQDKFTTFVRVADAPSGVTPSVPKDTIFNTVQGIAGKSFDHIMGAILTGVVETYRKKELPFITVGLEKIDAGTLGEFMQYQMITMMFLGKLFNVNPFDQPDVESYKNETRMLLGA